MFPLSSLINWLKNAKKSIECLQISRPIWSFVGLEYFKESEFEVTKITYDLHSELIFEENVVTEHEKMFSEEGIKIKSLIAKLEKSK